MGNSALACNSTAMLFAALYTFIPLPQYLLHKKQSKGDIKASQFKECVHQIKGSVGDSCVLAATFKLGSWSIAFTHWKVYKARAINIQLCGKAQLIECIEGGRDFVPC